MSDSLLFLAQLVRHWRTTGAIAPSSRGLARTMVEALGDVGDRPTLLELGPGTGVFTRELARRFPKGRIVSVEVNGAFATRVEQTTPEVTVVRGCASRLPEHLCQLGIDPAAVSGVVSGLPLLSLPGDLTRQVFTAVAAVLPARRRYVQFTYSVRAWRSIRVPGFERLADRRVWQNVPPAVVLTFPRIT